MNTINSFIHPDILAYSETHTVAEDPVLQKINRNVHLKMLRPRMLSGHYQGVLLSFVSRMIAPSRILEIGSFVGYSAICLAKGLKEGGILDTIECDEELEETILENISLANLQEKIHLIMGDALAEMVRLTDSYDLIFLDADKRNYPAYYELLVEKLKPGGFLLADNVLWNGKVCYPQENTDKETEALRLFNETAMQDQRMEAILLPIRDGLMVLRKKEEVPSS